MAVWTVRIVDGEDPPDVVSSRFDDVAASHPHVSFIERFAELGITKGCGDASDRVFCPDGTAVRAQMAVFLHRAFDLPQGPASNFSDIPADAWYASSVDALLASGITQGCGDGSGFCPDAPTSRAHMAVFLHRAANRTTVPVPEPSWSTPQKQEEALKRLEAPNNPDPAAWSPTSRGMLPPPPLDTTGELPAATPTVVAFSDWCFYDSDPVISPRSCSYSLHAISFALNYDIGADEACVTDQHKERLSRIKDAALAHNERLINVLKDRHGWHTCSTVLHPEGTEDCRTHAAALSAHLIEHYGMPVTFANGWESGRYVSDVTCSTA